MTDDDSRDPFAEVISLVAGPIAAAIRSVDQLRHGSDEFVKGLENFNTTMASLNETANRINALLEEVEGPIRTVMPQVTRTMKTADEIASRLSGPVEQVAPGLQRLAEVLNSPVIASLPTDLSSFVTTINDLGRRLGPLSQLAETAGGMFGLRLPGRAQQAPAPPPATDPAPAPAKPATAKSPAKKSATKRSTAKKKSSKPKKRPG